MKKIATFLSSAALTVLFYAVPVIAETEIGDGKLYTCSGSAIISVKTSAEVPVKKALAKYKAQIQKLTQRLALLAKGKKRTKALQARSTAKQGLRDTKSCRDGLLDGTYAVLLGSWNIVLENGNTPEENGYNSLVLQFFDGEFVSELEGDAIDCHWEGDFSVSESDSLSQTTTVAVGGGSCDSALNQTRSASISFSEDGDTLTLDYRPNGALQVYERITLPE